MSTRTKYIVWIKCRRSEMGFEIPREERIWEEQGDGPLGVKTADRIAREIKQAHDIRTLVLPVGRTPVCE
jgi:hypothetical protein